MVSSINATVILLAALFLSIAWLAYIILGAAREFIRATRVRERQFEDDLVNYFDDEADNE